MQKKKSMLSKACFLIVFQNIFVYLDKLKDYNMSWIDYPQIRPTTSRTYLVSIQRPYVGGDLTFKYVAYYNVASGNWHKCDGFDEDSIKEIITDRVVGWIDVPTYLV